MSDVLAQEACGWVRTRHLDVPLLIAFEASRLLSRLQSIGAGVGGESWAKGEPPMGGAAARGAASHCPAEGQFPAVLSHRTQRREGLVAAWEVDSNEVGRGPACRTRAQETEPEAGSGCGAPAKTGRNQPCHHDPDGASGRAEPGTTHARSPPSRRTGSTTWRGEATGGRRINAARGGRDGSRGGTGGGEGDSEARAP